MKENDFQPHLNLKASSQTYLGEVKIKAELACLYSTTEVPLSKALSSKALMLGFSDQTVDVLFSFPGPVRGLLLLLQTVWEDLSSMTPTFSVCSSL